jgi:hypothetical protein
MHVYNFVKISLMHTLSLWWQKFTKKFGVNEYFV